MLVVNQNITIEDWELVEVFARASGPGGQNVNKVETAVQLRFSALGSPALTDDQKARLKRIAGQKWTKDGVVVLSVDTHRSQARNRELARERLLALVKSALIVPKRRRPTKPTYSSKLKRLTKKKERGQVKVLRNRVNED
jgi:ribosome-associated protein